LRITDNIMLLSLLADISVLNGALLVEHNVALYLERCSGSVGSIDMDHCICNAPIVTYVLMSTVCVFCWLMTCALSIFSVLDNFCQIAAIHSNAV